MNLKEYVSLARGNATSLANAMGKQLSNLSHAIHGRRSVSPRDAVLIERHTDGMVTRKELRSDWKDIWPELK